MFSEQMPSYCHFIHHKSKWTGLQLNPGHFGMRLATNCLNHGKFVTSNPPWEHANEITVNLKPRSWLEVQEASSCYAAQLCK